MPCPVCPCPTAATPLCLPSSSITAPVPSLPSHPRFCACFFFPCPSSSCCFSPSLLLLLSRLCPIPAPLCSHDSQIHRQLHSVAASPAQGALSPLGHCCSSNAPSHPKSCFGGCCFLCCGWKDSRMCCTTGSCRCLHPLPASSGLALPPPAAP